MGVVVLNLHQRQGFPAAPRLGVGSGEIVRMEVADNCVTWMPNRR